MQKLQRQYQGKLTGDGNAFTLTKGAGYKTIFSVNKGSVIGICPGKIVEDMSDC
jgi:hypothetical protein